MVSTKAELLLKIHDLEAKLSQKQRRVNELELEVSTLQGSRELGAHACGDVREAASGRELPLEPRAQRSTEFVTNPDSTPPDEGE